MAFMIILLVRWAPEKSISMISIFFHCFNCFFSLEIDWL